MDNDQPLTHQQIIDRISSERALHAVLAPLLEEVRHLRAEISELREVLGGGTATKYLTIPEVAELFGVCAETVRRRARKGEWPAVRIGNQTRFGREDIEAIRELGRPKPPPHRRTALETRQRNKALLKKMPAVW